MYGITDFIAPLNLVTLCLDFQGGRLGAWEQWAKKPITKLSLDNGRFTKSGFGGAVRETIMQITLR